MINIEDIKVGKTYLLPFEVIKINGTDIHMRSGGVKGIFQPEELTEISRESAPKYDPCRLFKRGDVVRVVERNGRFPSIGWNHIVNQCYTVKLDEDIYHKIMLDIPEEYFLIDPAYLELVTPVEELEPYVVRHNEVHSAWSIYGPFNLSAANYFYGERYPYTKETAKEAAVAERDRLNAEWRKEQ